MNRRLAHTLVSYCPNLKWQRLAIFVVVALAETAMSGRVKQAARDPRASGKTMFAS
jgi:hypothetical protein